MRKAVAVALAVLVLTGCASSQSVPDAPVVTPGAALTLDAQTRATERAGLPQGPGAARGVVYDMNNQPLSNILLFVNPDRVTLSAADGSYRFASLEYGDQKISALSHNHIDAADGQTAFVYANADIVLDFHLAQGLDTDVRVRLLDESEQPLSGAVGFFRLNDLKLMADAQAGGDVITVTVPAGDYWVETLGEGPNEPRRGALLTVVPNRVREGDLRLFREPPRELEAGQSRQITVAGTMTPPEGCDAMAYAVQAVDRDDGQSLGAVFSVDGAYEITFSTEDTEGRYLIRYDAVCSRTHVAADVLPLALDPEVGGRLTFNPAFDTAQ